MGWAPPSRVHAVISFQADIWENAPASRMNMMMAITMSTMIDDEHGGWGLTMPMIMKIRLMNGEGDLVEYVPDDEDDD